MEAQALSPWTISVDRVRVDPINSSLSGIAAAQTMFDVTAQAATGLGAPATASGASGASASGGVDIAVLRMALDTERSLVNIFA